MFVYKVMWIFYIRSGNILEHSTYRTKLITAKVHLVPKPSKSHFMKSYCFLAPRTYNILPSEIKYYKIPVLFSRRLRVWLFKQTDIEYIFNIVQ